jgi:hypothetical protein
VATARGGGCYRPGCPVSRDCPWVKLPRQPAAEQRSGGGWKRKVQLAVTVGDDGLIRRWEVSSPQLTQTTEYVDLGEPQVIQRPQPDTTAGP